MRILLDLVAVSPALAGDSFIVVLKEADAPFRSLPIIIGVNEANAIVLQLQGKKTARPMTHDLLASVLKQTGMQLEYVCIRSIDDGVYMADVAVRNRKTITLIDARTSDALALAVRANCPIYAESDVLDEVALTEEDENADKSDTDEIVAGKKEQKKPSKRSLQDRLQDALDIEDYEEAARLRDEISGQ